MTAAKHKNEGAQMKNDTYSGYCLLKCLNEPPSVISFLTHVKATNIGSDIDRQIFQIFYAHYNEDQKMFSPLVREALKGEHRKRIEELRTWGPPPFENDIPQISEGMRQEYRTSLLLRMLGAVRHMIDTDADRIEIVDTAQVYLDQVRVIDVAPFEKFDEAIDKTIDNIKRRQINGDKKIRTGFQILDWLLDGGFSVGEFVVIASMTGQGKSIFMGQVIQALVEQKKRVVVFGLEMDECEYIERMIASTAASLDFSDLKLRNLANPKRNNIDLARLEDVANLLRPSQVFFSKNKNMKLDEFKRLCQIAVYEHKIDAIFLDHTLLLDGEKLDQPQLIEGISKFMKNFATEHGLISFAITQMVRNSDLEKPKTSDMAGGRAIEHQATTLLSIGMQKKMSADTSDDQDLSRHRWARKEKPQVHENYYQHVRKINVLKSRTAKSGTNFLTRFRGHEARFVEIFPDNWDEIKKSDPNDTNIVYNDWDL